jgi:hypothetical protein
MTINLTPGELNLVLLAIQENINDNIDTEWWTTPFLGRVRRENLRLVWDNLNEFHLRALENELKQPM